MSKKPYDWPEQWEDEKEIVGVTESAVFPEHINKENYKPRTLVDKTLEIVDPTPNIHTLFVQFNDQYFWNKLLSVEVKWSNRMTTCAGTCTFHPRNRECVITLSAPLLKLRPRKDLVETLLHEMIHGYLFLTNNNRDRDGHGPEFCKHMNRINTSAGTDITIYHSFHDEVKLYKQHWWRCNGPCQYRAPFFGNVRRAMNRAPGPNDLWWKDHERNCNGQFIKIKEPNKDDKINKNKKDKQITKSQKSPMDKFITITKDSKNNNNNVKSSNQISSDFVKLGTSTNKVHGFGTGGPGSTSSTKFGTSSSSSSASTSTVTSKSSGFSFSGTLGGAGTGKSNLLDKYLTPKKDNKNKNGNNNSISLISPPRQNKKPNSLAVLLSSSPTNDNENLIEINDTDTLSPVLPKPKKKPGSLALLLSDDEDNNNIDNDDSDDEWRLTQPNKRMKHDNSMQNCPICLIDFHADKINEHIDLCLLIDHDKEKNNTSNKKNTNKITTSSSSNLNNLNTVDLTDDGKIKKPVEKKSKCVICKTMVYVSVMNTHLDRCLDKKKEIEIRASAIELSDGDDDDIIEVINTPSTSSEKKLSNTNEMVYFICCVCGERVKKNISLKTHLETCVPNIYDGSDDDIFPEEIQSNSSKFPCPSCSKMVDEKLMNVHLDNCVS